MMVSGFWVGGSRFMSIHEPETKKQKPKTKNNLFITFALFFG